MILNEHHYTPLKLAVTEDSVLASARGELLRISLKDYAVSRIDLVEPNGILGNLVSVDGKLMAANAAGVAAYFPYESFRAQLTARIAAAKPAEVPDLLYRRGMNAFNATRPSEGLGDLLKAHALASEGKLDDLLAKTAQALYRTYVSLGNRASTDEQMVSLFEKAAANAYSLRSRGEMMVRMIKYTAAPANLSRRSSWRTAWPRSATAPTWWTWTWATPPTRTSETSPRRHGCRAGSLPSRSSNG